METNSTIYDDFEPFCRWQRDSLQDTLELHLPGFKREQLKVQRNDKGVVSISGERAIDNTHCSRFRKEIKICKNCNVKEINAKLSGDFLRVIFPKKTHNNNNAGIIATNTSTSMPSNFLTTFATPQCSTSSKLKLALLFSFVIAIIIAFVIFANKRCVCPC